MWDYLFHEMLHITIQAKFKHASFLFFVDAIAIFILIKRITNHYDFTVFECDCKNKLIMYFHKPWGNYNRHFLLSFLSVKLNK